MHGVRRACITYIENDFNRTKYCCWIYHSSQQGQALVTIKAPLFNTYSQSIRQVTAFCAQAPVDVT